jgi:dipeptidyl aminopeptidase/acylaminoacyl peptidase
MSRIAIVRRTAGAMLLSLALTACSLPAQAPRAAGPLALPVPSPSPSVAPTPSPTPLPLLAIEAMRQKDYPGSEIAIEETLAAGANYHRYLASYRSDGLKIFALLTVPNGPRPGTGWPVVVFNHGYIPPAEYRTTERYVAYVDGFARNGYIVFRSDYRGHGSSEGRPSGAYGSPDYTTDVLNAVRSLKHYPDADPNRIGMWGHSMGGHITLRAMVTVKDEIKAGVIWAGVVAPYSDIMFNWTRPPSAGGAVPSGARAWRKSFLDTYGTPEQNPQFWNAISPNSYLGDLTAPIQLHHGTADHDVPLAFSETLNRELQEAGKTVEFYTYPGDDHNISSSFWTAMQRSIAFFNKYLKG